MYEKNNLPPIKGREAWATDGGKPGECDPLLKQYISLASWLSLIMKSSIRLKGKRYSFTQATHIY